MTDEIFSKHYKKLVEILRDNDTVNTHHLQRVLRIGYYKALKIYKYLKNKKIISGEKIKVTPFGKVKVGIIDEDRLKETLYN